VKDWLKRPDRPVWIHAVSVGKCCSPGCWYGNCAATVPNLRVFLTVGTPTGRRVAEPCWTTKPAGLRADRFLLLDDAGLSAREPTALILVENEIWPNMLWRAKKMGIPVCLVNSRLSRRNRRLFRAARTFVRPVLQAFDWIGVQSEEDLGRFAIAGFPENRLHLMGSMKYDVADLASDNPGKGREIRKRRGLGSGPGSAAWGEAPIPARSRLLAELVRQLKDEAPEASSDAGARAMWSGRRDSAAACPRTGLKVGLRSRLEEEEGSDPDILLGRFDRESCGICIRPASWFSSEKPSPVRADRTSSRPRGMGARLWPGRTWRISSPCAGSFWRIKAMVVGADARWPGAKSPGRPAGFRRPEREELGRPAQDLLPRAPRRRAASRRC
jgi:hypothetical protein